MKVSILSCNEYNLDLVKAKIKESLALIDCVGKIKPNDRVLIKPNCLGPFDKDAGITTHPVFVQAVIQIVKEYLMEGNQLISQLITILYLIPLMFQKK